MWMGAQYDHGLGVVRKEEHSVEAHEVAPVGLVSWH